MPTTPHRPARWLIIALTALLCLSALVPSAARADTNLEIGGAARVAYANGDDVRLRAAPGYDADVLMLVPEGTTVDVLDGPLWAPDGSAWYNVAVWGEGGFMAADFLAVGDNAPDTDAFDAAAVTATASTAVTTTALNLRSGPSFADAVLLVMPAGATVSLTGSASNGFLGVIYNGRAGWAYAAYLQTGSPGGNPGSGSGTASVTSALNLRAGPSVGDAVLLVMPAGSTVTLTGQSANGFVSVSYNGTAGWAYAAYLNTSGAPSPSPSPGPTTGTATTTTSLNLRAGPSLGDAVLTVMPAGATVGLTGSAQNGFYPVTYGTLSGWAYGSYLNIGGSGVPKPSPPPSGGSSIVWPFEAGAEWYISQGYNGSSHYNSGSSYQYYYSFDLARRDGSTAGQAVLSPVTGTIRWIDESTGGMSIDLGNGYAVAFFHVTLASGLAEGQTVYQGQYMGYVSGPGGQGFRGFPHIHLTVWQTNDGGNWSRIAIPFTGAFAIQGQSFPDIGGYNQHYGTSIWR